MQKGLFNAKKFTYYKKWWLPTSHPSFFWGCFSFTHSLLEKFSPWSVHPSPWPRSSHEGQGPENPDSPPIHPGSGCCSRKWPTMMATSTGYYILPMGEEVKKIPSIWKMSLGFCYWQNSECNVCVPWYPSLDGSFFFFVTIFLPSVEFRPGRSGLTKLWIFVKEIRLLEGENETQMARGCIKRCNNFKQTNWYSSERYSQQIVKSCLAFGHFLKQNNITLSHTCGSINYVAYFSPNFCCIVLGGLLSGLNLLFHFVTVSSNTVTHCPSKSYLWATNGFGWNWVGNWADSSVNIQTFLNC